MKVTQLAKTTIEKYIKNHMLPEIPESIEDIDVEKAGTFVSIKTNDNELRGCIGTIVPTKETVAEEIIYNAIAASTQDPRFVPIEENELDNLKISVDILHAPENVNTIDELDPKIYGVIVSSNGQRGLLLPNLEGVDTVNDQLKIAKMKAGMAQDQPCSIMKFKVDRYSEN